LRVGRILDLPAQRGLRPLGCPVVRSLFAEPASDSLGLPPRPRTFGCAGDVPLEFPRTSHAFSVAGFSKVLGFPSCSRLLLQRLRYSSQVALCPVPPALPAMDRRVAPILASFGGAGCESSRLPLRFAPPVSPTIRFQVAPVPYLRYRLITSPSHLGMEPSGSPRLRPRIAPDASLGFRRSTSSQVALKLPSFGVADSNCLESPRNSLPRLIRICFRRLRPLLHLRLGR
jgi:hypothetical protein